MYKSDIEIAQACTMQPITEIAKVAGVEEKYLELYGNYKAKVDYNLLRETDRKDGKLILVTAINPTPAGEGKTTTTVGLADGLRRIGKNTLVALREPSLGPVFGVKGGAAGGGWAQVVPMEDINLHFTGDMHAITAANNLLCAMIDNHLQQGNALGIDPRRIIFTRVMDMNDRALRNIVRIYPYDVAPNIDTTGDGVADEGSLRGSSEVVAERIKQEIQEKVKEAGLEIIEARITYLAYAPEIAAVMLQRQQASAIIDARKMIVDGAVGMVEMALERLNENDMVTLDDERKAAMISNLLVVLCGNHDAQPIVNTGSLY